VTVDRATTTPKRASLSGKVQDTEVWDEAQIQKSQRAARIKLQCGRFAILLSALAVWHFSSGRIIDPFWVSSPSDVAQQLGTWLTEGILFFHLQATLTAMAIGLVLGASTGIMVGFVLGRIEVLARLLDPFIVAIYSLPKVALAPLFILWFGIGLLSKVVLTAVIVFFLVFYNTFSGVRSVDRDLVDVVRVMGGSRRDLLAKVVLPSSAAWIYTGLRIAIPYSLIGAVVGEIVASNRGIGYLLARASGTFNTAGTFAALFILMIVATLINSAVDWSESRTSRWRNV
jgi:NitT/TauT family transport system permease protein